MNCPRGAWGGSRSRQHSVGDEGPGARAWAARIVAEMRKPSHAWKALAFTIGCGAAALAGVAVRAYARRPQLIVGHDTRCPSMRDEGPLPFGRLRREPLVCAAVDGGDVVAVDLGASWGPQRLFRHLHLDLRRGALRTGGSHDVSGQEGCVAAGSALSFVRSLLVLAPRSTWDAGPVAGEQPYDPNDDRWRLTWHIATGAQFLVVLDRTAAVDSAVSALVDANPSSARRARDIAGQRDPTTTVSFEWRNSSCGHCGDTFVRGVVHEDGVYVVEAHDDEYNLLEGGRVAADDARAFARWLRARGWGRTSWENKGNRGPLRFNRLCSTHPPARAWVTALGIDLSRVTRHDDIAPDSAAP
jgi:hypothetical protein